MASADPAADHKLYRATTYANLAEAGGRGWLVPDGEICLTDAERSRVEATSPGALEHLAERDCECQETC